MQHIVIRLTDFRAEALNDAINSVAFSDRKGTPAMETRAFRNRRPAEPGVSDNVGGPKRLAGFPDTLN
jgi:hypothetical protein